MITTTKGMMDEALLEKREGLVDNPNETTLWTEYWLGEECIHRSVHVTLKQGLPLFGEQGKVG